MTLDEKSEDYQRDRQEKWLREDVRAGHAEYIANPSSATPAEQVLDRIKARRRKSQIS